jgi:hypothetical protein
MFIIFFIIEFGFNCPGMIHSNEAFYLGRTFINNPFPLPIDFLKMIFLLHGSWLYLPDIRYEKYIYMHIKYRHL